MFNGMGRAIHPQVNVISFYSKEWMINKSSQGRPSNGEEFKGPKMRNLVPGCMKMPRM